MDGYPTKVSAAPTPNEKRPRERNPKLPRKPVARMTKIKHTKPINTVKIKLKLPKPTEIRTRNHAKKRVRKQRPKKQINQMEAAIPDSGAAQTCIAVPAPPAKKGRASTTNCSNELDVHHITGIEDVPLKKKRGRPKKVVNLPSLENLTTNIVQEVIKEYKNLQDIQETCKAEKKMLPMIVAVKTEQSNDPNQPATIGSRNTSVSDTFSWAKEISSSSSTTTLSRELCPKDVKIILAKIDSDTTSHSEKHSSINGTKTVIDGDLSNTNRRKRKLPRRSMQPKICRVETGNLTTSTSDSLSSSEKSSVTTTPNKAVRAVDKLRLALDNINEMKRRLDIEFYNWIGDENVLDDDVEKLTQDLKVQFLKPEIEFIKVCQSRRNSKVPSVSNNDVVTNDCDSLGVTGTENIESIPPDEPEPRVTDTTDIPECFDDESFSDTVRRKSDEYSCYDDDDVISLFAGDSLAGDFTECRKSVASPLEFDEFTNFDDHFKDEDQDQSYVEPVKSQFEFTKPNEIPNTAIDKEIVFPDSTSKLINREEIITNTNLENVCKLKRKIVLNKSKKPLLMKDRYVIATADVKCRVLKGVCFFNLVSNCKRNGCLYIHQEPSWPHVLHMIYNLRDEDVISDYMIVRKYPSLRARYTAAFVDECDKRGLTNCLLEMVIDSNKEGGVLKTYVREATLLHLNKRNLNDSADLLKLKLDSEQICDALMRTMAETENFTRFKPVFVKLTSFMVEANRIFPVDVATMLLERILILPFEETLVSSLILVLKNTDRSIFKHSLMSKLVNKLSENNQTDLLNDLEHFKMEPNPQLVLMPPPKIDYNNVQYPIGSHKY